MSKTKTKKNNIDKKWLAIGIFFVMAIIVAGTYAWLTYRSNNTSMVLTIGDIDSVSITLSPYQINASIAPSQSYSGQKYSNVVATNNNVKPQSISLYYDIETIDSALINSNFRYTILRSYDNTTFVEKTTGNFSTASSNSQFIIFNDVVPGTVTCYYKVYIWLYSSGNQSSTQNKVFKAELQASIVGSALPNGYTQVEYLESYGNEYILTNTIPNSNTYGAYAKVASKNVSNDRVYFGSNTSGNARFWVGNTGGKFYFGWNTALSSRPTITANTVNTIKMNYLNNRKHILNSTEVYSNIDTLSSNTYKIAIFAGNKAGTMTTPSVIKLYELRISNSADIVADFIPCIYGNTPGVYDIVNGVFYQNSGSGGFTTGEVIQ